MLNFKQFVSNASAWLNGTNDINADLKPNLPINTLSIPTISTDRPVRVFRVNKKGNAFEILAEKNISWYIPAPHYVHLLNLGKAPIVGDRINLTFYKDGTVKDFAIVERKEKGLAS